MHSFVAAKYYFYDNYFDLPGALLCARAVDMLNKVKINQCFSKMLYFYCRSEVAFVN